ncbi:IS3 family transposase [Flavobacterium sp. ST-75]|uniref:IS3 family transposase n=1 Tax=Flavobacterium rhizophilum TaxID=3163296 RepID=A0ABW8YA41_9FLAO
MRVKNSLNTSVNINQLPEACHEKVTVGTQNSYQNRYEAESTIKEYIEVYYNSKRRHKHLGNETILECQKHYNHK